MFFGWIEASLRYGGVFGSAEKTTYRQVFGLSEGSVSRHQAEFEILFEEACGKVFARDRGSRVQGGKLILEGHAELPEKPVFSTMPSLDRWLQENLGGSGYFEEDIRRRDPDLWILRPVIRSIRSRTPLSVAYHSRKADTNRVVSPHAIVRVKGRLHIRAYDHLSNDYRDFVLTRITKAALDPRAGKYVGAEKDIIWRRFSTIMIEDKGALDGEGTRTGVRLDFGLDKQGRRKVRVREALVSYHVDETSEGYSSPVTVRKIKQTSSDEITL